MSFLEGVHGSCTDACGRSWSCRVSHPKGCSVGALGPGEAEDRLSSRRRGSNLIKIDGWPLPGPSGPTLSPRHFWTHFGFLLEAPTGPALFPRGQGSAAVTPPAPRSAPARAPRAPTEERRPGAAAAAGPSTSPGDGPALGASGAKLPRSPLPGTMGPALFALLQHRRRPDPANPVYHHLPRTY